MTATTTTTDTLRQTSERLADAMSSWTTTCMETWRRSSEALFLGAFPGSFRGFQTQASVAPTGDRRAGSDSASFVPRAMMEAAAPLREHASTLLRGLVDLGAGGTAELARIGGEQARFMARISERGFDCAFGPQPARTSEALMATVQAMGSDLMENAAAVGERLIRLGARNMEHAVRLFGDARGVHAAGETCCGIAGCGGEPTSA